MKQKIVKIDDNTENKETLYYVQSKWNDFGNYITFNVHYNNQHLGDIKIIKPPYSDTIEQLENDGKLKVECNNGIKLSSYYSLGNSDFYRNLYKNFDAKEVGNLLENMNDIAYNNSLIKEISEDSIYKEALLRGINENYVKTVLSRISHDYVVKNFDINVTYSPTNRDPWNSEYKYTFKFDPDTIISSNLHAIIGNNGVGKSRLLRDIALSIGKNETQKFKSEFLERWDGPITRTIFNKEEDNVRSNLNNIVYISLSPFDKPSDDFSKSNKEIKKVTQQINNYFLTFDTILNNFESLEDEILNQIQQITKKKNLAKFKDIILENFSWDQNIKNFFNIIQEYILLNSTPQLEEKNKVYEEQRKLKNKFAEMSSGQKSIIIILILTLTNILENSLLIIDEPENYLHPPYISTLITTLTDILQKINGAGIIATHSDVVVQELPHNCVHILDEDHKMKDLKSIPTYGNSLDVINQKIFGLDMQKTGFYSKLRKIYRDSPDKIEELKKSDKLGMQAKIFLTFLRENNNGI